MTSGIACLRDGANAKTASTSGRAAPAVVAHGDDQHDADGPGPMIHDAADDVDPPLPHEAPTRRLYLHGRRPS